jgi:serine/threonine-protein kinase RsbW
LRGDIAELERLSEWIQDCTREGMPPDVSYAIQLCLEEAVANVIIHGAAATDDRLAITVELERSGRKIVARLEDNSWQFDPTQAPPRPVSASLEEATVGDFGISLMRRFASGMEYERRDGRNRLTLRFVECNRGSDE